MISERDLRLAKAIVDPYIGRDIIATAVLGTKLGTMLNENAYREVVDNAQRLIDGTECIPQGKTLEFILRNRYVETIKTDPIVSKRRKYMNVDSQEHTKAGTEHERKLNHIERL